MNDVQAVTQEMVDELVGASHGDFARVREILEAHPELVNASASWVETPIQAATQLNRREIIDYLLEKSAPMDIFTAVVLGRTAEVKRMLSTDPGLIDAAGVHGFPLMYFPAIVGNEEIADLLLARGADVNAGAGGNTALHGAAMFGQTSMVRWLLEHNADPQAPDYEGKTPGQVAADRGYTETAELLAG